MIRCITALLLLATASVQVMASGDAAIIPLDDIEGAKAARLMKNKEDIDVQSTYHEYDIKDTGEVLDDHAARLVKNRGPITAKISASGSHSKYCDKGKQDDDCSVQFSLVAWKFAGDEGEHFGMIEEKFKDGEIMKVDVDCMVRNGNEAIVGGKVTNASRANPAGNSFKRRAYVKVVDDGSGKGDFISDVVFDDGIDLQHCKTPGMGDRFDVNYDKNVLDPRVSVCSKHGDWENCLKKMKIEQAVE